MSSPGDDIGRRISRRLINSYFTTQKYPYTRHHIDSFDQFMGRDLQSIIRSSNPILIVKDLIKGTTNSYAYKVELFVGGPDASAIKIGTPIVSLNNTEDVRVLFPNEARLRNLSYATDVSGDIMVRITYTDRRPDGQLEERVQELTVPDIRLFRMPIMLHSRYCLLNGKPKEFLQQAGECPYDHGGYFVVDGSEKVLVSRQEKAFNTLYIAQTQRDPKVHTYATLSSLSSETRAVKYFAMAMMRETPTKQPVINVSLPFIRKPINVFILFRLMGVQADEDIVRLIFPDADGAENRFLADKLIPTIVDAHPILSHYTALQFIKTFTKGFSEVHIIDIIRNQLFVHIPDLPGARVNYLAECVRSLLRVAYGFDKPTDRDDIRNQRCLTSGFLIQMLFNGVYAKWRKAVALTIDKEYNYNAQIYSGESFANIFDVGNKARIFNEGYMSEAISRAFKGKWGAGLGEEKAGVLQSLSRLSYLDFMSHCRRVVLEFDTSVKLTSPRNLHPSQFGYFCTNETPGGASIGITKNLSILTYISTGMQISGLVQWLHRRGGVATTINAEMKKTYIPVTVNNGIVGYTATPLPLVQLLKAFKHTGFLPATTGIGFSYADRRLFIMTDEGRPLRPLIVLRKTADGAPQLPVKRIAELSEWRDLVIGTHPGRANLALDNNEFLDPLAEVPKPTFEDYMTNLTPHLSILEYVDPYEQNESYIACFPENINAETTHMEVHPSTVGSLLTTLIPYANHNQSVRNQLSCSQSKQGVSIYATNWQNRFDNSGHILCYGEAPLARTMYYDYMAEGKIGYGTNVILALAMYDGYNQEDGVVINKDALERGLFRSVAYRSYEFYEEDDEKTGAKTRIGNPARISGWTDLKPGRDYTKLDDRGIVRVGTFVDEDTVICGGYMQPDRTSYKDASIAAQVWTSGIVENVSVMVNNKGLRLVKIRVVQDRSPELGDKFCLTPEHEVLTSNGWKTIDTVNENDSVCTLDDKQQIIYANPTGIYSFNCDNDELYHVKSQQVELITTMEHKMYVKKRNANGYTLETAKDIIGKRVQYKKNGTNTNKIFEFALSENTHHSAKNPVIDMDAFLEFLGFWISDGWVSTYNNEHRIELSLGKTSDMDHVADLVKKMGYSSYSNKEYNKLFISSQTLGEYLKLFSNGAANKYLPEWTWNLSESQCRTLLKGLIGGDGHISKSGVESFYTTSLVLADQFQRLCLHAGWSASKTKLGSAGTKVVICGKQTQLNSDYWGLTIIKSKNEPMVNHGHTKTQNGQLEEIINYSGSVHCIEVPNHIFYVRYNGKCVWTGNSNRHGQKGTIGMMFPGRDMPRTADGIVPDIIVNPHCIPSRMTIAQVLEQLLAKLGAVHGAIGDATTFMNEGSTADAIGDILENEYGFERTGNEILYDGKSGVQIPTAIFVAPVYHMRLKHMVEDKWQARTNGRREQRTHQPTGGRGKEGGLRIGEMDRDAIVTHGISAFLRESYMKRSDGETFPICTGCGTVPIYNERLGIAVCPMCQGPLRFAGDTADTLELIPPLTKQTAPIVKVEMPFTLKLLDQELNTFMNGGFRFLTSGGGTAHINIPLPAGEEDIQSSVQLMERVLPESYVPDFTAAPESESKEGAEANAGSLANLASLAKKAGLALVPLETAIQRNAETLANAQQQMQMQMAPPEDDLSGLDIQGQGANQMILPGALPPSLTVLGGKAPTVPVFQPQQQLYPAAMPTMTQQQVMTAATGPLVVVDTSPQAMREVIEDVGIGGANAGFSAPAQIPTIRRAARPKQISFGAAEPTAAPPSSGATITVNKLG